MQMRRVQLLGLHVGQSKNGLCDKISLQPWRLVSTLATSVVVLPPATRQRLISLYEQINGRGTSACRLPELAA